MVVSAATGVTDLLISILENLHENKIPRYIDEIVKMHDELSPNQLSKNQKFMEQVLRLQRVLYGICYTEELSETLHDLVLSFGERLITFVIMDVLKELNRPIHIVYPEETLITNGRASHASIDLVSSEPLLVSKLESIFAQSNNPVIIIPGFYGISPQGKINLLGRSGTDYSASAVAYLLNSKNLTIWKDVPGFLSADPRVVPNAHKIPVLNYGEASELSHFGAKILHHRAVLPAKLKNIPIYIRNIYNPDETTLITSDGIIDRNKIIKSISYKKGLAILKFFNSIGASEAGVMDEITTSLNRHGIDIISVATSQTCIAFLVDKKGAEQKLGTIESECSSIAEAMAVENDIALVACVGEELSHTPGVAFKVFGALARKGINVDLISAGASTSALHFTVKEKDLDNAVLAIHDDLINGQ